jgi:hypothetical protein
MRVSRMNVSVSVPDHQKVPLLLKGIICLKGKIAPPSVALSLDMIYSFRQKHAQKRDTK